MKLNNEGDKRETLISEENRMKIAQLLVAVDSKNSEIHREKYRIDEIL